MRYEVIINDTEPFVVKGRSLRQVFNKYKKLYPTHKSLEVNRMPV